MVAVTVETSVNVEAAVIIAGLVGIADAQIPWKYCCAS